MTTKTVFKTGDTVPQAGRYICRICGFIIEFSEQHITHQAKFGICPVCQAGTESGPVKPHEDFWEILAD